MKKSPLISFLIILVVVNNGCSVFAENSQLFNKVDELFAEWDTTQSPGCALAVIQDGKILYKKGYGMADLEHEIPITPDSVFYIGSVSKQFVTMCILLLEEKGKLSLDDDIRKYIPEFPEYESPVTVRHLIHHTSGIRDYLTLWQIAGRDYKDYVPKEAVLDMICRQKELNFPPGEQYLYSNSCYFLLAVIVEKISGLSFSEFAGVHIFRPLGMDYSHFLDDNTDLIEKRAFGYFKKEDGGFGNMLMRFDLVGSGGLYTSVEDLYLWDQNFYHNILGEGRQELIEKMKTKGQLNSGKEIDYAFAVNIGEYCGAETIGHGGSLGGYRAQFLQFPDFEFSVIILSNLADFNPGSMAYKVADILLEDRLEKPQKAESRKPRPKQKTQKPKAKKPAEVQLGEYAGNYYNDEINVFYKLSVQDGGLQVKVLYNSPKKLEMMEKDVFRLGGGRVHFQRGADGHVESFIFDAGRVKNIKFVKQI